MGGYTDGLTDGWNGGKVIKLVGGSLLMTLVVDSLVSRLMGRQAGTDKQTDRYIKQSFLSFVFVYSLLL